MGRPWVWSEWWLELHPATTGVILASVPLWEHGVFVCKWLQCPSQAGPIHSQTPAPAGKIGTMLGAGEEGWREGVREGERGGGGEKNKLLAHVVEISRQLSGLRSLLPPCRLRTMWAQGSGIKVR